MDELRMFLENEGWELCPVKSSFSIMQLQVRTVRISLNGPLHEKTTQFVQLYSVNAAVRLFYM